MNFFNDDYNDRSRPDLNDPVPERGLKRWLFIFSNHFTRLVGLNLLFLLCCLPIVTIPASLCALTRVLMILYDTGSCSPWQDFRGEFFRCFFGRFLAVFLLCFFPVSLCLWFFAFGMSSFGVGVGALLIPVCSAVLCYFLAFTVDPGGESGWGSRCSDPAGDVRRAFLSAFRNPLLSLKLLLVPALYFVCFWYLHYTVIIGAFILFAGGQLTICCLLEDLRRR